MLRTEEEIKICKQYGERDEHGHVHCYECPLRVPGHTEMMCKAITHYNAAVGEWEFD